MNTPISDTELFSSSYWNHYLEYKGRRSHILMAWCGLFIYPAFGLLDYFVVKEWELFLAVRFSGAFLILTLILLSDRYSFKSNFIAHFSCQVIMLSLMWMISRMENTNQFFIYSLNTSTAYIASAIFLLWHSRNSIFLAATTVTAFTIFCATWSVLSFGQIIASGTLPLFTIVIMSQLFVFYRYNSTYHDFKIQHELNRVNEKLREKNVEIYEQNLKILKQKDNLEDLNDLKDRLLMIISHDFRSPLHSLKGLIMLINDSDNITPEEFRMLVKGVKHKVDNTYDFLENLLIWSRSQMKGFQVKWSRLDLSSLLAENMSLLQSISEKKQITIENHVNPDHVAHADEDMIRLVIRNLLINAIKFTPMGGKIQCQSMISGKYVKFLVRDNGVGMDALEVDRLFNLLKTSHKKGTNLEQGTGLGLMLCKDFIEKNNGTLEVASQLGKGSIFSFTLLCFTDPIADTGERDLVQLWSKNSSS
ncbi:MAG TPA: HAMP domain-containing sensor histidine kinase [Cyclobacteriaceae bacterium]|nr:HAMP domain-containing sensor histidine kinase [Cyclobacteriaceae bacterium]